MPSPWKVCPVPSLSSSTSSLKERSMAKRGLEQRPREPYRDRRHEEHQREAEQPHEEEGHHSPEDVAHRNLRRRSPLHAHGKEPMRRKKESALPAVEENHPEPDLVDAD